MVDETIINSVKRAVVDAVKGDPKVRRAYLFGSYARGEQTDRSDFDISLDTERGFTLVDASNIRLTLTELLRRDVDIVAVPTKRNTLVYDSFERDKVLLYER